MKQIQDFPKYAISTDGQIWSSKHKRYLKPYKGKDGRLRIVLWNKDGEKKFLVHRLVAQAYIPNPLNLPFVNHMDCDPTNNNVSNLEWVTPKENVRHAIMHGQHPAATARKLDHEKVAQIKVLRAEGKTLEALSKQFGVSTMSISGIARGKLYAWETYK